MGSWYKVLDKLVTGGTKSAAMKKMLFDQVRRTDSFTFIYVADAFIRNEMKIQQHTKQAGIVMKRT